MFKNRQKMELKTVFLCLCIVEVMVAETEIKCTNDYCVDYITNTGCPTLSTECIAMNSTHHGTYLPYADVCNCCDYCLKNLAVGDMCITGLPGQLSPSEICGPKLSCTSNGDSKQATCQALISNCTKAQDEYDQRKINGILGSTEVRPECDDDGFYQSAHCIPGSICYCVAPNGERMFGEIPYLDPWDVQKMSCGCSLNDWKARNTLDPKKSSFIPVARCLSNGLFDPLQCMMGENATCLCVNTITGSPVTNIATVIVSELEEGSPSCFDSAIHTNEMNIPYDSKCEIEFNTLLEEIQALNDNDIVNHDIILPSCQPDGKYARIQTNHTKKICVDPSGVQIGNYTAEVNSMEDELMDCNCARTQWLLAEAGVVELPSCCSFGNFEAWQCRRNECFCVDTNGNQIGREVDAKEVSSLACYESTGNPCSIPTSEDDEAIGDGDS